MLCSVELFEGLETEDLNAVADLCSQRVYKKGDYLAKQGEFGDELFIISEGLVQVSVREQSNPRIVVNLGVGQLIGEMSLVDRGPRSASVRAVQEPTIVQVISHEEFHQLCEQNNRIGYTVMLNLAADLSFKLRHRHLSGE